MAISYTQNSILFGNIPDSGLQKINYKPTVNDFNYIEYGLDPFINMVEANWNGAQLKNGSTVKATLNTTGEMLSILQTAYNYATTYNVKYNDSDKKLYDDKGNVIKVGSDYTLPTASSTVLGGVKVGDGLSISDGKLSVDSTYYITASDLIARSYITTSDADEKYAYKYHAYDGTTYGIGTADLYGHLKISSAYTTYTSATDIALSLKGAYYMYKLFVDEIDKLNKRIETLESYHAPKPVTSVTVTQATYTLYGNGDTAQLTYSITPTDAANTSVTWASSNDTFVFVDRESGVVTSYAQTKEVDNGYVIITATANDGSGKCGYCYVTVNEARIARVNAGPDITSTYVPNLSYTISPKLEVQDGDGTVFDDTFTFTVKEGTNVSLNSVSGKTCELTILGTGISYIEVKSNADGKTKDTVVVTINNPVNYYWYAGWTEPDAENIATIVNETYPKAKDSTEMNPAGKTSTTLTGQEMNFTTNPIYDQVGRNIGNKKYYYIVVPNGYGILSTTANAFFHDSVNTFNVVRTFNNHTVYKFIQNPSYIITGWKLCEVK